MNALTWIVTNSIAAASPGDVWADAWRILFSFFAFVALTLFWFRVIPNLGVPAHEAVASTDDQEIAGPIHPRFEGLHRGIARLALVFTFIIFLFCSITYYAAFRWGFGYSP